MTDNARLTEVPRRVAGAREDQVDGELLVYMPTATRAVYLNGSAATIWGLCDGVRSLAEMVELLAENYPEAAKTIDADVIEAIDQLRAAGIIEPGSDQPKAS